MSTARSELGLAAGPDGRLYAVGGWLSPDTPTGTLEVYDPGTDRWESRAAMPTARGGVSAAFIGGRMYAVGGADAAGALAAVEEYDPISDTWRSRSPMPTARQGHGLAVLGDRLYAAGGHVASAALPSALAAVEEFDAAADRWRTRQALPEARTTALLVAASGQLFLIGGTANGVVGANADGRVPNPSFAYDPVADRWSAAPAIPTARGGPAGAALGSRVVVTGGYAAYVGVAVPLTEELDLGHGRWRGRAALPAGRVYAAMAATDPGRAFVVGGMADPRLPRALATFWEYVASPAGPTPTATTVPSPTSSPTVVPTVRAEYEIVLDLAPDYPAELAAGLRDQSGEALRFLQSEGVPLLTGVTLYAVGTLDEVVALDMRLAGRPSSDRPPVLARWSSHYCGASAIGRNLIFYQQVGTPACTSLKNGVADEYFHAVQTDLTRFPSSNAKSGPTWLTEGGAEYAGYGASAMRSPDDFRALHESAVSDMARVPCPLAQLEGSWSQGCANPINSGNPFAISYLAVEHLRNSYGGVPALLRFHRYVGDAIAADPTARTIDWRPSFQRAFGLSAAAFYAEWEARVRTAYPTAVPTAVPVAAYVRGRVLRADGSPAAGWYVVASRLHRSGGEEYPEARIADDGAYALPIPIPGMYEIRFGRTNQELLGRWTTGGFSSTYWSYLDVGTSDVTDVDVHLPF